MVADPLVVVGAGGLGRETAFLVEQINAAAPTGEEPWAVKGFVDDDPALKGRQVQGMPVLGDAEWLLKQDGLHYVVAIGASSVRRRIVRLLEGERLEAATLVHPEVALHASTEVGAGTIVAEGVVLTVGVSLGRHVLADVQSSISHDARVADFATIHPGGHLTGNTHVEAEAEIGAGAVVLPGIRVGTRTVVGAGAVVHRDLPAECTAVGVPARLLPS